MTILEETKNTTFSVIANVDGQPEAIYANHQAAVEAFEAKLDEGITNLDLTTTMTATDILGTIELSELPNMISGPEWPAFAEAVRAGYEMESQQHQLPDTSKQFLRDGVQPDIPAPLAQKLLNTLNYYTAPRFPEFQHACELGEIIIAERDERPVDLGRFSQASMTAQEPYSMLYLVLTSDALEDGLKEHQRRRGTMESKLEPSEAPAAMCNADATIQKLEYALEHLRPDQRIKEEYSQHNHNASSPN